MWSPYGTTKLLQFQSKKLLANIAGTSGAQHSLVFMSVFVSSPIYRLTHPRADKIQMEPNCTDHVWTQP